MPEPRPLSAEERAAWLAAMAGVPVAHWPLHCATKKLESPVKRIERYEATIDAALARVALLSAALAEDDEGGSG